MVLKRVIWQISAIVLISIVLGIGTNLLRPDGIAMFRDWSEAAIADKTAEGIRVIPLSDAARLHREGAALFIDARPRSAYDEGHIRGAVSLPWQEAEEIFIDVLNGAPPEKTVITYCDGISCELSDRLADFLIDIGYADVYVLPDGWARWNEKGLPTARN